MRDLSHGHTHTHTHWRGCCWPVPPSRQKEGGCVHLRRTCCQAHRALGVVRKGNRIAVRGRGRGLLLCSVVERESWRLGPWQHPASLRPHALTDQHQSGILAGTRVCQGHHQSTLLEPYRKYPPNNHSTPLRSTRCCVVVLCACLSVRTTACAHQSCLPACTLPAYPSHNNIHHRPLPPALPPARLPERA